MKLSIGIISTHSFPIGLRGPSQTHTGDVVIMDLVRALSEMGHDIHFFAPEGSYCPPNVKIYSMRPSFGKYPPSSQECEMECFNKYCSILRNLHIVHDFSVSKKITQQLNIEGKKNTLCTLMGGPWTNPEQPHNLVAWSKSHRYRIQNGFTDYYQTPLDGLAGPNLPPLKKEVCVVNGGVDTTFYYPTYQKKDYILWMGRWSKPRGYLQAIEIAKANQNINFKFSGGKPEDEYFQQEKECAFEAIKLAKNIPNIEIDLLPADPEHHTYKRKLYQEARGFLYNVQFGEPWGLMQCEALACGTPIIGTNYGSIPEVIEDGITGYVKNNTVEDLSSALNIIEKINPKICRQKAIERFDIKIMANNYIKEYNKVINGGNW